MPTNQPTIVPVYLDPMSTEQSSMSSLSHAAGPSCVIKTAAAEISFFNGVEECIIQAVIKELIQK